LINVFLSTKSERDFLHNIKYDKKIMEMIVDLNNGLEYEKLEWHMFSEFCILELLSKLDYFVSNIPSPSKLISEGYDLVDFHDNLSVEINPDIKFNCSNIYGIISKVKIRGKINYPYHVFDDKVVKTIEHVTYEDVEKYKKSKLKCLGDITRIEFNYFDRVIAEIKEQGIGKNIIINNELIKRYMKSYVIPHKIFKDNEKQLMKYSKMFYHGIRKLVLQNKDMMIDIDALVMDKKFMFWRFYLRTNKKISKLPYYGLGISEESIVPGKGVYDTGHYDVFSYDYLDNYFIGGQIDISKRIVINICDILDYLVYNIDHIK
jgi:hypothetical protein